MVGDGEKRMAKILRESALKIINKTYEVINEELKKKQGEHNIWLKDLSDRMERINKLRVQTDYFEIIDLLDTEGIQEYFNLVGIMAKELDLSVYSSFVNKEVSEINLQEINYLLTKYRNLSNWEYDGHGNFIAKKNATLWELGGVYWYKLFELPENPDIIHIGDKIKLKEDVINIIYDYFLSDINGQYFFDTESPEPMDILCGIIGLYIDNANKIPRSIWCGNLINDISNTCALLFTEEETGSKLSFFIQQYTTEGQEEDAWKKFLSVAGFFGPVFSFLNFLGSTSIEENKYNIVIYNQRKAFINSAEYEIQRIQKLQESVREKDLQTEINYLRFLEKQISLLKHEIELNDKRERQQLAEILYNFSRYNTHGATYKDTRTEKSSMTYHTINYRKLFEENQ